MIWLLICALTLFIVCAFIYSIDYFYAIDVKVTLFFEQIRTPFLTDLFMFISNLGSIKYYLPICVIMGIYLLFKRKVGELIFLFATLFGVRQINYQLKDFFVRERPTFDAVYEASHYSFPSGHAMNSTAIYGFIGYLFITHMLTTQKKKILVKYMVISLIALIGISRIYLGVHYLTDVLAGWSAGFICFLLIMTLSNKITELFDKNRRY